MKIRERIKNSTTGAMTAMFLGFFTVAAIAIIDGVVKSFWPMACLYRSLRFGEEYLPVSALLVDKT